MELLLFFNLLCAHLIADFWVQTDKIVVEKRKFGFKGKALYVHSLTVALISSIKESIGCKPNKPISSSPTTIRVSRIL